MSEEKVEIERPVGTVVHPDHSKQADILLALIKEYNISDVIAHSEIMYALLRAEQSGHYLGYRKAIDEYARGV